MVVVLIANTTQYGAIKGKVQTLMIEECRRKECNDKKVVMDLINKNN